MKKVLLATLFALVSAAVVVDASAWGFGRRGCGRECAPRSCPRVCKDDCPATPVAVSRVEEQPCGQPPCCLTAVQVPAQLVKEVSYHWECPTGCTVQSTGEATY